MGLDKWLNSLLQNRNINSAFAKKQKKIKAKTTAIINSVLFYFISDIILLQNYCKLWPILLVKSTSCAQNKLAS